jgi:hypothetical protein
VWRCIISYFIDWINFVDYISFTFNNSFYTSWEVYLSNRLCQLINFISNRKRRISEKRNSAQRFTGMHYHYHKLLVIICVNLLIFNFFYILFVSLSGTKFPSVAVCETIGILLHFSLISSFFLMSVMSVLRYMMIREVFSNIKHFNIISISIAYVLSMLIVIITVVTPPGPIKYVSQSKKM